MPRACDLRDLAGQVLIEGDKVLAPADIDFEVRFGHLSAMSRALRGRLEVVYYLSMSPAWLLFPDEVWSPTDPR